MRMLCDACNRPTMPGITNIQMQAGQPVMGVGGFAMKLTRSPEFFVLCDPLRGVLRAVHPARGPHRRRARTVEDAGRI